MKSEDVRVGMVCRLTFPAMEGDRDYEAVNSLVGGICQILESPANEDKAYVCMLSSHLWPSSRLYMLHRYLEPIDTDIAALYGVDSGLVSRDERSGE